MTRATNEVPTGESLKIAVLAALNIADELFRVRDGAPPDHPSEAALARAQDIERLVDQARSTGSICSPHFARGTPWLGVANLALEVAEIALFLAQPSLRSKIYIGPVLFVMG